MLILKIQVKIINFLKKIKCIENRTHNKEIELAIGLSKRTRKFIAYQFLPRRKL